MERPRVWLLHGFNVSDGGAGTVDRLADWLNAYGYDVQQFDYGWIGLAGALMGNEQRARDLAREATPEDIAIGHSNGCAIIHRASHLPDSDFARVVYLNPALDVDAAPGPGVRRCDVFHARDDVATLAARFIPGALWGSMGRDGYIGGDPRMRSHEWHRVLGVPLSIAIGHSGAFRYIDRVGPYIERVLREGGDQD